MSNGSFLRVVRLDPYSTLLQCEIPHWTHERAKDSLDVAKNKELVILTLMQARRMDGARGVLRGFSNMPAKWPGMRTCKS